MSFGGSSAHQVSFGMVPWSDKTTLTGAVVSGNVIGSLSGLTASKYDGMRMRVLKGTNKGKVYHVVTNDTTSITLQESASGFAATDNVVFELRAAIPTVNNIPLVVPEDFDFPTPDADLNEVYAHGNGQDRLLAVRNKISFERTIPFIMQNWRLAWMLFGQVSDVGTDSGTGGSTVKTATDVGEISVDITDGTGYANGEYIQFGTGATAEVRKIVSGAAGAGNQTFLLDWPLYFAHAALEVCNEVTYPYTHTIVNAAEIPWFDLVGAYTNVTPVHVRDCVGIKIVSGELNSSIDALLQGSFDIAGMNVKTTGTQPSVTMPTTDPYHYRMVDGGLSLNGIKYATIEAFAYRLDRGLNTIYAHQSTTTNKPWTHIEGKRKHELSFTIIPLNSNIYDLIDAGTVFTAFIRFLRGTGDEFTITWAYVTGSVAPHGMPIDGPLRVNATFHPASLTSIIVIDNIPYYPGGS